MSLPPQDDFERFREAYARARDGASSRVERAACGHVLVNGYTTVRQAERLASLLTLGPGSRFLDLGSGRGWPGLRIAEITGSDLVASDVPIDGLAVAKTSLAEKGIPSRVSFAAADGRALPFLSGSFDAVVHADVFC